MLMVITAVLGFRLELVCSSLDLGKAFPLILLFYTTSWISTSEEFGIKMFAVEKS